MVGQSAIGIGVTMFLRDQFSGPARRIKSSAHDMQDTFNRLKQQQDSLRHTRNLSAGMAMLGVAALRGVGSAVKRTADLRYELQFVQTITRATADEQKRMGDLAKYLGESTMFYSQDVAEGMRYMGMAGMSATEIIKNITAATYLAGSTLSQIGGKGGAADIITNVMKAFNIEAERSMEVADMLSAAVTSSNTNLFDLGEALKYSASTAMDMGVPLQEATAMVMALGNAGMQGSMAGVAMENSMRYIARAVGSFGSGTQKKALDMLGLSIKDVTDESGNLLSMVDVIRTIGNALENNFGKGMNVEKQSILQTLFGVRGKRAGSLFIRNLQDFDNFVEHVGKNSANTASNVIQQQMEQVKGYMLRVKSSWQNLMESFGYQLIPVTKVLLGFLEKTFQVLRRLFDHRIVGPILSGAIAGFIAIKTAALAFKAVMAGIKIIQIGTKMSAIAMGHTVRNQYDQMTTSAIRFNAAAAAANATFNQRLFRGTGGYVSYTATGGMRMSKSATRAGAMAGPPRGFGVMAPTTARNAGLGAAAGLGAIFRGGKGLLSLLGGIKGILVTLAISGIVTLISSLISRFRENREALDENTSQLKGDKGLEGREIRAIEYLTRNRDRISAMATAAYHGPITIEKLREIEKQNPRSDKPGDRVDEIIPLELTINIDGQVIDKRFENMMRRSTIQ